MLLFWNLLLFQSTVHSLGVLPRVSSILELLYNCCVLKKPQFVYICHEIAILIILGSILWFCMGRDPVPSTDVGMGCLLLLSIKRATPFIKRNVPSQYGMHRQLYLEILTLSQLSIDFK